MTSYLGRIKITLATILIAVFFCGFAVRMSEFISVAHTNSIKSEKELSIPDMVEKVIGNVVHVRNNSKRCQGSGVLIASDLILTARHVVEDGENFDVKTNDGCVYPSARAISSKKYDLGFIKLDPNDNLPKCTTAVGSMKECRLGESLVAIGSPYGDDNFNSVTAGILSSTMRNLEGEVPGWGWSTLFQTDAAGHPGNSGCPVYTLDGKVRGILVGGMSNAIIYCIPAELIINDCQTIQLMFLMDQYRKEIEEVYPTGVYYNHEEDSEYYK